MIIRKEFKFEMAHIVRNAYSTRCAKNIHGHSYVVEVFFEGKREDDAGMLIDFGILKDLIKDFIDIFDHSTMLHNLKEDEQICNFFYNNFERVIISPFPTTAEFQSKFIFSTVNMLLEYWKIKNQEEDINLKSVRVHETKTGYAECDINDVDLSFMRQFDLSENPDIMGNKVILSKELQKNNTWINIYNNIIKKYD